MKNKSKGQAMVTLLFFVIIAITVTSGAVMISIANTQSAHELEQSFGALQVAESGAEEALLRLIRDPEYVGGTIAVGDGISSIVITGDTQKIATSSGKLGDITRSIQVQLQYDNNVLTLVSWKEVY